MARSVKSPAAEERFKLLVESVKDYGIFMLDPTGHINSWNEGAQRIKGYKAKDIIGKHFSVFYTDEDRNRKHPENELKVATKTGRYEDEGWRVRKDGTRFWANVVITALYDENKKIRGFAKVTRDMTERKRAEDKLRMANEELEARVKERTASLQQAVQARDEFLSIASHELRTPITPLKLQIQNIIRHLRQGTLTKMAPEKIEKMTGTIELSFNRLGNLIDNLLDVARISAGKIKMYPEEIDAVGIIREICTPLNQEAKTLGSKIDIQAPPSIKVFLDPLRLGQIVTNLVTNAIKYGNSQPIIVRADHHNGRLIIQVIDRGVGISLEDQKRIFQRFEQGKTTHGATGLGLGLYISKQIVDAQGGSIRVDSDKYEGSTFIVELPLKNK